MKAQLSREFSRNPNSTLTTHSRPTPEYKSFPLAALQSFDEGQSRASLVASLMPKKNSG